MPFGVSEWTPIRLLMSTGSRANMKAGLNWRWAEVHIHSSPHPRSAPPYFLQRSQRPATGAEHFLQTGASNARGSLGTHKRRRNFFPLILLAPECDDQPHWKLLALIIPHLVEGDFSFPSSLCLRMSNLASQKKKCFCFLPSVWPWVTDSSSVSGQQTA